MPRAVDKAKPEHTGHDVGMWAGLMWLEPGRLGVICGTTASLWMMVFFALRHEPVTMSNPQLLTWGLGLSLLITLGISTGLAGFGLALNDLLDIRHDQQFQPTRPLASGGLGLGLATALGLAGLTGGLWCCWLLGVVSLWLGIGASVGLVLYNILGRFLPSIGTLLLGLIFALAMVIPNPQLSFAWPIVLAVSHVMFTLTVVRMLTPGRMGMAKWEGWALVIGWAFFVMLIIVVMSVRVEQMTEQPWWLSGWIWLGPAVMLMVYGVTGYLTVRLGSRSVRRRREAADRLRRLGWAWLWVYATAWLASSGLFMAAAATTTLGVVTWAIGRLSRLETVTRPRYQLSATDDTLSPPI